MKFFTTSKISENMHETPEGYLVCTGVSIARTGEMIYGVGETPLEPGPDGTVVVSRSADEVFRPETIASFEGKSFVVLHPDDFVSPENWVQLTKGVLQNVRRGAGDQENDLVADILITDGKAIELVKSGLREVSCGYEAEYTQTGVGRGTQSKIIGNHLALVQEGRAGSSYAINDHKGKGSMKLADKIKAIFAKAQDEALKVAGETKDMNTETPETKTGFVSYDDFKKAMDDFGSKMDSFMGGKKKADDESTKPDSTSAAKIEAKDEEDDEEKKKKAARDAWIDEQMAKKAEDDDEDEEMMTGDEEEMPMTGDAARIEILAPGMDPKVKNAKAKALLAAYATTDGKAAIDCFTNGQRPDLKNENQVETCFIGASEILKARRSNELSKTKTRDSFDSELGQPKGKMTPEELNKINAEHYKAK